MPYKDPEHRRAHDREPNKRRKEYLREYNKRWRFQRRIEWINSQGGKCVQCGSTDNLEVDHIDPRTKELNPAALWGMSPTNERRIRELAKCQILCHECHIIKNRADMKILFPLRHGTNAGYVRKCKCVPCKKAHAIYSVAERARIKAVKGGLII